MTANQGYRYRHVIGNGASGHTTLSYLTQQFDHSTVSQWKQRIDAGEVLIDDQTAHAEQPVNQGSTLVWNRPGWVEPETPQSFDLIYQDSHLVAVDKPSGLPTLPGGGFYENTLLSMVQLEFPEARPLHRLGRATSGITLFALSKTVAGIMSRDWPQVRKQYQALGQFVAKEDSYDIRCPIGPQDHPRLGKVHAASPIGKPARSVARPIERRLNETVFEVDLHTGRPHQIRIHLASIGHPLVGDPLYVSGGHPKQESPGLPGDPGYWLHAKQIEMTHPISGSPLDLQAPLPDRLQVPGAEHR